MRWEDERYVRFYTRDTPEWDAMNWRARGLFGLILRVVDRAGILKLGKRLGLRGVSVAVKAPWEEVQGPLQELLDDGCVRYVETEDNAALVMPNFLAAQEAPMSTAERKRKSRETALADLSKSHFVPSASQFVPDGSRSVTNGHGNSRVAQHSTEGLVGSVGEVQEGGSGVVTKRDPRGTRLSEDWQPSEALVQRWSERGIDARGSLHRFRNHFCAKTGKDSTKRNWDMTFDNWVEKDVHDGKAKRITTQSAMHSNGECVPPTPEQRAILGSIKKVRTILDEADEVKR